MLSLDWYSLCQAFSQEQGLALEALHVLDAFPWRDDEPSPSLQAMLQAPSIESFAVLLERCSQQQDVLQERINDVLSGEVDEEQAALFARRFGKCWSYLIALGQSAPEARLWAAGITCRLVEILLASGPRALRVRALSDFYTSQAAILQYKQTHPQTAPSLEEGIKGLQWRKIRPHITHALFEGPTLWGPAHINLLRAERPTLQMFDSRPFHQMGLSFPEIIEQKRAVAGVSGGFFLYSEENIRPPSVRTDPVGLLVHQGQLQNPPVLRRATLLQAVDGSVHISRVGMEGVQLRWRGGECTLTHPINGRPEPDKTKAPTWHNAASGRRLFAHSMASFSLVGHEVLEAGVGISALPLAGGIVCLPDSWKGKLPTPGEHVTITLPPLEGHGPIVEAMAGGPLLLEGGQVELKMREEDFWEEAPPVTFSQDETFDQNLLPRMAAGLTPEGVLYFAAIDGRHVQRAPGLTLHATASLMKALGCERAMNLDGGSSKRMVIEGKIVDLPSTEVNTSDKIDPKRIRHVHTAIALS